VVLSVEEKAALEGWTRRRKSAQALSLRARIVLGCAGGQTNSQIAATLHVTKQTVGKWRAGFLQKRLDGLLDEPRPGAPRRVGDEQIEAVVTRTLESAPRDATNWSTRSMAEVSGLSHMTVKPGAMLSGSLPKLAGTSKLSAPVTLKQAERSHILQTLHQTEGVVGGPNGAAARLGLPRTTLISRMPRLGINHSRQSRISVTSMHSSRRSSNCDRSGADR
jgi:transposase